MRLPRFSRAAWAVAGLVLASAMVRFLVLGKSDFAPGLDGYYYAKQVAWFLRDGSFAIPDSSPVLWLLVVLAAPFADPVLTNKIGAALLAAALVPGAYLVTRRLAGRIAPALLAAGLVAVSPGLGWLATESLKNLGALVFFLFYIHALLRLEQEGAARSRVAAVFAWGALALLSHRTTAVLVPFVGGLALLPWLRARFSRKSGLLLLAALAALPLLFLVKRGGLHPHDLARFEGVFAFGPFHPAFSATFRAGLAWPVLVELSMAWFAPWIWLILRRRRTARPAGAVGTALAFSLFPLYLPFYNLAELDMGFRLFIAGLPLVWIVLAATFAGTRQSGSPAPPVSRVTMLLAGCAVAAGLAVSTAAYEPRRDPPYASYLRLFGRFSLPEDSLLICHQGLSLFYTYTTGREALNWQPEYEVPQALLWRLTAHVPFALLSRTVPEALADGSLQELEDPYHLVREDAWRLFMDRIPPEQAAAFRDWYNPHRARPAFLAVHQAHLDGKAGAPIPPDGR